MPIHRQPRRPLLRLTLLGGLAAVVATAVVAAGAVVVNVNRDGSSAPTAELAADSREQRASRNEARETLAPSPSVAPSPSAVPAPAPTTRGPAPRNTSTKPAAPPVAIPASCSGYSGNRAIGCALLGEYGFAVGQMGALDALWTHESGWNAKASNPSSGAYGIPQALPGSKMGTIAADWRTNPATQIRWGLSYIRSRYGSPASAWSFWQAHNWY